MNLDFLKVFKSLGDETRLRIVNLLVQSGERLCVCEMTDALLVPQYQVSRHLSVLRHAGIVHSERDGTWIYYALNRGQSQCLDDLLEVVRKHFSQRYPEDIARLNDRLAKREDGRCVIGYALTEEKPGVKIKHG